MYFETGHIYHIYNQGNNRQRIFFERANYLFFLEKAHVYISPYADVLAWCLMPNHFHFMVYVKHTGLAVATATVTATDGVTSSHPVRGRPLRTFNNSIGIMLRSFTRAVNNQQNSTGNLFREETKAICLTKITEITPNYYNSMGITHINVGIPVKQYPNICFNYILNNPVKDGLVTKPGDWEFSSYLDTVGLRNGKLINRDRINELGLGIQT